MNSSTPPGIFPWSGPLRIIAQPSGTHTSIRTRPSSREWTAAPHASSVIRLTPVTTPALLICWGTTLGGPHWNTGDATWDSPLCIRYVTSRSPYHLPNFSHPTALHAPTTSINTKPFRPILKYIETLFIHEQSLIGIASQPKPLTVRRPTGSDSGSRSSPHSGQRSLHRLDIPLWKFADYSPGPDPNFTILVKLSWPFQRVSTVYHFEK